MAGDNRPYRFLKTVLRTIGERYVPRCQGNKKGRRSAPPDCMGEEFERGRIADPLTSHERTVQQGGTAHALI